jgi:hypothetical protein
MVAPVVFSVEDIVNMGLRQIGYAQTIADLYEGSTQARAALDIFTQTRDETLRAQDWSFARRTVALAVLKGPPPPGGYNPSQPWTDAYPRPGWLYEYTYPADCLRFRAVVPQPGVMFDMMPQAAVWQEENDNSLTVPARVILTNLRGALGVYTAQITDTTTWEPLFITTLADGLAKKLAIALRQDLPTSKAAADDARMAVAADDRKG